MGVTKELYANNVTFGVSEEWCDCLFLLVVKVQMCVQVCAQARV